MAGKRKSLGKGLANIYGDELYQAIDELESSGTVKTLPVAAIRPNPYQPRKEFDDDKLSELAESLATHGLLVPIIVREAINGYELVAGERRLRAAKIIEMTEIAAVIEAFSDQQMMEISLLENIQRENLNAIEEAGAYQKLLTTMNYTQETLASRVNKSRTHITNLLRLLKLPVEVQDLVLSGKLSMGHVRPLITITDKDKAISLANKIVNEDLSVRQVESLVKVKETSPKKKGLKNKEYQYAEGLLSQKLQTSVKIDDKQIIIKYQGSKDLNRILEILDCLED